MSFSNVRSPGHDSQLACVRSMLVELIGQVPYLLVEPVRVSAHNVMGHQIYSS